MQQAAENAQQCEVRAGSRQQGSRKPANQIKHARPVAMPLHAAPEKETAMLQRKKASYRCRNDRSERCRQALMLIGFLHAGRMLCAGCDARAFDGYVAAATAPRRYARLTPGAMLSRRCDAARRHMRQPDALSVMSRMPTVSARRWFDARRRERAARHALDTPPRAVRFQSLATRLRPRGNAPDIFRGCLFLFHHEDERRAATPRHCYARCRQRCLPPSPRCQPVRRVIDAARDCLMLPGAMPCPAAWQ